MLAETHDLSRRRRGEAPVFGRIPPAGSKISDGKDGSMVKRERARRHLRPFPGNSAGPCTRAPPAVGGPRLVYRAAAADVLSTKLTSSMKRLLLSDQSASAQIRRVMDCPV